MALSAFGDKSSPPSGDDVAATLGSASEHWDELRKRITSRFPHCIEEWGFTSNKTGWGLRLKTGNRVVVYMTPGRGCFLASLALGEKAVRAAHDSDLPASVLDIIDGATKYPEGRGVRIEVRTASDVACVDRLATIKMTA